MSVAIPPERETSDRLDAVLPLRLADLDRFRILERSIELYLEALGTCWVVTPDADYDRIAGAVAGGRFMVLPESWIAPELADFPEVVGWHKQQLIKLAAAERVGSDFYLTLDADVICTRAIRYNDLIRDGRALCQRQRGPLHGRWYEWAERVLGLPRSGWVHGVTPAILHRGAVGQLAVYLSERQFGSARPEISFHPRGVLSANAPGGWRRFLLEALPWTEYALYFTFLEARGQFEQYYQPRRRALYGGSVWMAADFDAWDPAACFAGDHFFSVIQSNMHIPAEVVWRKLGPLLETDVEPAER